jgi:predicted nucleic acid-binding protein
MTVFADTSFWVALAARADRHHAAAAVLWQERRGLITSNHVLGETWTFLNRRHGHQAAQTMVSSIRSSPRVSVRHVPPETEDEAWRWLSRRDEREYSFVDATSFAFMRRHGITDAYAFDGDFSAAGFTEVRP